MTRHDPATPSAGRARVDGVKPGDVVLVGAECSVQFAGDRALRLRVSADPKPTYDGWIWIAGYVLDARGLATDKREVFVMKAGLRVAPAPAIGNPGHQRRRQVVRKG
ncbi:hypothetical protein GA0070616_2004 [Micromonospora nigra]|uniref:Uncharacterized protein n=1 Tax=Micromonospora nigra TaxID=145857 RepID=A0A1C6RTX7_9ACTN|nr:hypothetical protein [Micromonospora nigra]SCL20531.1 hypothetical protein GA0070616_2004 [Micromonospora nigra]